MNASIWRGHPLLALVLALLFIPVPTEAASRDLETEVADAIKLFEKSDSSLIEFFKKSAGYVVFPRVGKGAMGIGAAHGRGILFEKKKPIGRATLTQVTIGFQLGGQVYAEVIFFEEPRHLENFKNNNFEFSAQASAVAAAEGVAANAKYEHGVAIFTLAKGGLMYEASIGGQKFKFEPYADAKAGKKK